MVSNTYIKCQVCGSITRVRLQVGWQEEHPIVVVCGKCGTSLSGRVKIDQERLELKFSFENADEILDAEAEYMVECSGELPTMKQGKAAALYIFFFSSGCGGNEKRVYKLHKRNRAIKKKWINGKSYSEVIHVKKSRKMEKIELYTKLFTLST